MKRSEARRELLRILLSESENYVGALKRDDDCLCMAVVAPCGCVDLVHHGLSGFALLTLATMLVEEARELGEKHAANTTPLRLIEHGLRAFLSDTASAHDDDDEITIVN